MSSNIRVNSITPSVGSNVAIGTAGGTVVFQCDTNISGVITATSFDGDLTGNVAGNVTGNTSGTAGGLTGSPSISVTNITASGNVSVAGTLTYEDVTNIDSVGIVTARSGIRVTGGSVGIGTDNPSAKLQVLSGSGDQLWLDNAGERYTQISLRNNGTQKAALWLDETTDQFDLFAASGYGIRLLAGGSEKLRITSAGLVGINEANPAVSLDLASNTDAVSLPTGTTAQRPSGTDAYIRKNSTNNALEFYNGTNWVEIITDYFPTGSTTLG